MNQRMIELYTQARKFAYKNISEEYWNTDNFHGIVSGKFAELIVQECANKVKDFYQEDEFTCYNAAEEIKQHFGVE